MTAEERRARVQGVKLGKKLGGIRPGTISWAEHVEAWESYAAQTKRGETAEQVEKRGGFTFYELLDYLGHEPTTWRPR